MSTKRTNELSRVVVRFAGDSGDGIQLIGDQFAMTSAMMGNQISTLPDYPSEIRAPAGTIAGVSGFQVCFGTRSVYTPGDEYDLLVAINPAGLKVNLSNLKKNGILLLNTDSFTERSLQKAGYSSNPLDNSELNDFRVFKVPMFKLCEKAATGLPLSTKQVERCKNFVALGITNWIYGRSLEPTLKWLQKKFGAKPDFLKVNTEALKTGFSYAAESGFLKESYTVPRAEENVPGTYRYITGNVATAMGLIAASRRAGRPLFLGSYPITPATEILHELSNQKKFATVLQAEDEIAGIGSAIGASFGGALAATSTSGPGLSLKSEFLGLAVILELPLVVVNVQRGGPSTGLPTKTEQADLLQAVWGRHGESPVVVIAATSPRDCFDATVEASRIALKYMVPVVVLTEGALGQGAEAWRIPALEELPEMKTWVRTNPTGFLPYLRDEATLARPWALPGTPGLEHRIGSLEKEDGTGATSHDPLNHEKMVKIRAEKVARIASEIPPLETYGDKNARLLVLGWGGTQGVIKLAVENLLEEGVPAACAHLRHLNPLPRDIEPLLKKYDKVLIPENNMGQLWRRIRAEFLINAERLNIVRGRPFRAKEIEEKAKEMLGVRK